MCPGRATRSVFMHRKRGPLVSPNGCRAPGGRSRGIRHANPMAALVPSVAASTAAAGASSTQRTGRRDQRDCYVGNKKTIALVLFLVVIATWMSGQTGQWITFGHDPQRSGFAADEHAFSPGNVAAMGLEWKTVVPNEPLFLTGLTAPLLVRDVESAGGSRSLVISRGKFRPRVCARRGDGGTGVEAGSAHDPAAA